jgi:4-amino-4-deoxy-L-arabinose transferase-like glycosyltransferase
MALLIPIAWAVGTLGFFSVTVSRLEHYALPALPAVVLLIAVTLREAPAAGPRWRAVVRGLYALMAATLIGVALFLPGFLATDEWLRLAPDIVNIPGPYFGIMAAAWLVATVLALRTPVTAVLITCAACLLTTPFVRRGFVAFAPVNSSAPVAEAIAAVATVDTRIVFEAPTEYQLVAGLTFYLRRPVTLLRPPGFVEPTYLIPYRDALFIDHPRLIELWREDDVIFVSNPLAPPDRPLSDAVPASYSVIAHIGNRWIVRNRQ